METLFLARYRAEVPPLITFLFIKVDWRRLPKGINDNVLAFKNYEKLRGEKVSRV